MALRTPGRADGQRVGFTTTQQSAKRLGACESSLASGFGGEKVDLEAEMVGFEPHFAWNAARSSRFSGARCGDSSLDSF